MKHLKKFLALALVCVMALTVLTGCGKSAKTYSSEVASKLGANSGVAVNETTTKSAEKLISGVKKIGIPELVKLAQDPENAEAIAKKILKDAGLNMETDEFAIAASGYGQKVMLTTMGSEPVQEGDASTYFANAIKNYNAKDYNEKKLTKYGIATYSVLGVDIVVLVAQY